MVDTVSNIEKAIDSSPHSKQEVINEISSVCSESISELSSKCVYIADSVAAANNNIASAIVTTGTNIDKSIIDLNAKVHESLSHFSSQISEAIIQSNDKLSVTALLFAIFVAFIGALSAYLFNHLHWRIVRKTNKSYSTGTDLIDLIQKLEEEALKYWVSSYNSSKKEEILVSEITIKSMIRQIHSQTKVLVNIVDKKKIIHKKKQINNFPYEIYDLVTGGEFESRSRNPSKRKAMRIAKRCSDARANISSIIMHI